MHDDKVRVLVPGANGHVVPEQVVGVELLFKPLGGCGVRRGVMRADATAQGGVSVWPSDLCLFVSLGGMMHAFCGNVLVYLPTSAHLHYAHAPLPKPLPNTAMPSAAPRGAIA